MAFVTARCIVACICAPIAFIYLALSKQSVYEVAESLNRNTADHFRITSGIAPQKSTSVHVRVLRIAALRPLFILHEHREYLATGLRSVAESTNGKVDFEAWFQCVTRTLSQDLGDDGISDDARHDSIFMAFDALHNSPQDNDVPNHLLALREFVAEENPFDPSSRHGYTGNRARRAVDALKRLQAGSKPQLSRLTSTVNTAMFGDSLDDYEDVAEDATELEYMRQSSTGVQESVPSTLLSAAKLYETLASEAGIKLSRRIWQFSSGSDQQGHNRATREFAMMIFNMHIALQEAANAVVGGGDDDDDEEAVGRLDVENYLSSQRPFLPTLPVINWGPLGMPHT